VRDGRSEEFLPSLAAPPGAILGPMRALNDEVSAADVFDEDGEQSTSLAVELEERVLLDHSSNEGGRASIIALGQDVTVHRNSDEFAESRASLLDPNADLDEPAPPHFAERGLPWPVRMGSESFISYGVFNPGPEAAATALLNGVVLRSDRRINSISGHAFVVARVRTAGFEADVCLRGAEHPNALEPGQIVSGRVFLTASLATFSDSPSAPASRRRWWRGR
jgi:hypothetical protein